jgi:hypothetical protein
MRMQPTAAPLRARDVCALGGWPTPRGGSAPGITHLLRRAEVLQPLQHLLHHLGHMPHLIRPQHHLRVRRDRVRADRPGGGQEIGYHTSRSGTPNTRSCSGTAGAGAGGDATGSV